MRPIQNVIFDLGNVLLNFKSQQYLESLFDDEAVVAKLHKIVFASPEWFMLDRGVITQEQAVQRLCSQHPTVSQEVSLVFADWMSVLTPIPSSVELLRSLKKEDYGLYVISNFHKAAFDFVYKKYEWFQLFDGLVISCDLQVLKPEPAIYQALLDKYQLIPERSVFIDDSLENVEAAGQFGIKGVHYQTYEQLKEEMIIILKG